MSVDPTEDLAADLQEIAHFLGIKQGLISTLRIGVVRKGVPFVGRFFAVAIEDAGPDVGMAWDQPVPVLDEPDPTDALSEADEIADFKAFLTEHPVGSAGWVRELPDRPENVYWFDSSDRLVLAVVEQEDGHSRLVERWVPEHRLEIFLTSEVPDATAVRILAIRRALLARVKRGRRKGSRLLPPKVFADRLPKALRSVRRATSGRVTQMAVSTEMGLTLSTFQRQLRDLGVVWVELKSAVM
jgi:hypothetical protein